MIVYSKEVAVSHGFPFDLHAAIDVHHSITRLFAHQRHKLLHEYTNAIASVNKREYRASDIVSVLDQNDQMLEGTASALVEHITRAAQRTASHSIKDLVSNSERDLMLMSNNIDGWVQKYGRERGAELLGKVWSGSGLQNHDDPQRNIDRTTRDSLAVILGKTKDITELEKAIDKSGVFSSSRATMIAATEINSVQNMAMLRAGYEYNGQFQKRKKRKLMKTWVCNGDNPCQICEENCGDVIELDETFPSGDFAPSVHPNCMCEVSLIEV